jgi:deoxyribose-phosphate aldolase
MDLAGYIEHTLLRPDADSLRIKNICQEAKLNSFFAVCIPPFFVQDAKKNLEDTNVKVATVVGYPFGYSGISSKVDEVKRAISDGADEIDMVVNLCAVKDAKWSHVRNDIDSVTRATHLQGKVLKAIIEASLLEREQIAKLCEICSELGVNFIKTSSGVNAPGASLEMVQFLKSCTHNTNMRIKASGGINTRDFAEKLIMAGASRIGTSSGLELIKLV